MKSKKGAGTVVAWVLLLGFSISLATTVFLWTTRQAEEMTESTVRFVEGGMQCDNVGINVALVDDISDSEQCHPPCPCSSTACCLKIFNTRYLNIEKVLVRRLNPPLSEDCAGGSLLEVKKFINCDESVGWTGKIEVMPLIKVNNDLVGCKNKAITIEC